VGWGVWEKGLGRGSGLVDEGVGWEGWGLAAREVKGGPDLWVQWLDRKRGGEEEVDLDVRVLGLVGYEHFG